MWKSKACETLRVAAHLNPISSQFWSSVVFTVSKSTAAMWLADHSFALTSDLNMLNMEKFWIGQCICAHFIWTQWNRLRVSSASLTLISQSPWLKRFNRYSLHIIINSMPSSSELCGPPAALCPDWGRACLLCLHHCSPCLLPSYLRLGSLQNKKYPHPMRAALSLSGTFMPGVISHLLSTFALLLSRRLPLFYVFNGRVDFHCSSFVLSPRHRHNGTVWLDK